jgi:hypothetical protein
MTVHDRLRATTEAVSGTMREVRPLTLPPEQPGRAAPPCKPRRSPGWLLPLTAAAAVIAVAATLVAVRDNRGASPAPTAPAPNPAATAIPRYYAELGSRNPANGYQDAIVGDSRTGKVLATVKPPAQLAFSGVTGAGDDRTFVIDATPVTEPTQPNHVPQPAHTWYLLRIAPGTRHPAELTKLPIAASANSAGIVGLALSPDAGTLAVLYQPGQDSLAGSSAGAQGAGGPFTLRTFSLATGKALRTWTAPEENISTVVPSGSDNEAGLTWTANGQTLAFMLPPGAWPDYERTLNVAAKGTNLLDDSRSVLAIPNPGQQDNCLYLLLASDGRTMICGTETTTHGCKQQELQFNLYSTATGRLTRVLYRNQGTCFSGEADVVWAGPGGTAIGLIAAERTVRPRATIDYEFGVLAAGTFTPLHVRMTTDYFDAGALAF